MCLVAVKINAIVELIEDWVDDPFLTAERDRDSIPTCHTDRSILINCPEEKVLKLHLPAIIFL